MNVQGVSISAASSMNVQGVSIFAASSMDVQVVFHCTSTSMDLQSVSLSTKEFMHACMHACASVPYAHAQHAHQFFYFSNVHLVYPQHERKELMCALSMRVRN
jgi:hypothetical protein